MWGAPQPEWASLLAGCTTTRAAGSLAFPRLRKLRQHWGTPARKPVGNSRPASGWRSSLVAAPGVVFAFLPNLICPACWPAYAALLSSIGLGFLLNQRYLLPLTTALLALAVGALAFRAPRRRGYRPFALGLAAAVFVLAGKFAFDSDPAMYGGIAGLVAASIWNAWPLRAGSALGTPCPACVSESSPRAHFQRGDRPS